MQREFSDTEKAFEQEVHAFIAAHWPAERTHTTQQDEAAWRRALVARGWSVPAWPAAAGGPGWSPTQVFIWRRACAARGVPAPDDPGIDIIGPLLLKHGSIAQQQRFLPDIRAYACRWCIGFAEPEVEMDWRAMRAAAKAVAGGYELCGVKTLVRDGMLADRMCCLARRSDAPEYVLLAVDLRDPAVEVRSLRSLDGSESMATVRLDRVLVPAHALLAESRDAGAFASLFLGGEYSTLDDSAVAQAQLDVLDAVIADFAPDDGIRQRRNDAAVALASLQAMELRYLDALRRRVELPFPLTVLRVKSRDVLLQLGALQVESFGYYALPYPDETLLHNEGPIGPEAATATVRHTMTRQVAALYEGSVEQLKDEVWRRINDKG